MSLMIFLVKSYQTPLNLLSTLKYHLVCRILCSSRCPKVQYPLICILEAGPRGKMLALTIFFEAFILCQENVKPFARSTAKLFSSCFHKIYFNLLGMHVIITQWVTAVVKFDLLPPFIERESSWLILTYISCGSEHCPGSFLNGKIKEQSCTPRFSPNIFFFKSAGSPIQHVNFNQNKTKKTIFNECRYLNLKWQTSSSESPWIIRNNVRRRLNIRLVIGYFKNDLKFFKFTSVGWARVFIRTTNSFEGID